MAGGLSHSSCSVHCLPVAEAGTPAPWQGWSRMVFRVPSNPHHYMVPWADPPHTICGCWTHCFGHSPSSGIPAELTWSLLEKQGNKVTRLSQAAKMRMTQPSWFPGAWICDMNKCCKTHWDAGPAPESTYWFYSSTLMNLAVNPMGAAGLWTEGPTVFQCETNSTYPFQGWTKERSPFPSSSHGAPVSLESTLPMDSNAHKIWFGLWILLYSTVTGEQIFGLLEQQVQVGPDWHNFPPCLGLK